jgi:ATP-dependent Clp protease ATP-binding subunit ClpC
MNGYNFTDRVRKVLQMAREEAARLHHEYVGTEHILLGLIREGEGVAAAVLTNLSVDLDEIQQRIEETVKKGKAPAPEGPDLPYTPTWAPSTSCWACCAKRRASRHRCSAMRG